MIMESSRKTLSSRVRIIVAEKANIDRELTPLLKQKDKLQSRIDALESRKSDLEKTLSDINGDLR